MPGAARKGSYGKRPEFDPMNASATYDYDRNTKGSDAADANAKNDADTFNQAAGRVMAEAEQASNAGRQAQSTDHMNQY